MARSRQVYDKADCKRAGAAAMQVLVAMAGAPASQGQARVGGPRALLLAEFSTSSTLLFGCLFTARTNDGGAPPPPHPALDPTQCRGSGSVHG